MKGVGGVMTFRMHSKVELMGFPNRMRKETARIFGILKS